MRALFKTLLAAICITMLWNISDVLIGSRKFLDQPRIHVVQDGEHFSKLAEKYYGNADYWRALALINRAPNVDKIFPGEHIILPNAGTVAKIARAQRLTDVNELVNNQQVLAALESAQEAAEFLRNFDAPVQVSQTTAEPQSSTEEKNEPAGSENIKSDYLEPAQEVEDSEAPELYEAIMRIQENDKQIANTTSDLMWPMTGVGALFIVGFAYIYRAKKRNKFEELEIDASPLKSFILENELNENLNDDTQEIVPASFSDDVFKPVRRRREDEQEKEVAMYIQEG